jgi:myo-inositol-1(or 4)-monophosphatase
MTPQELSALIAPVELIIRETANFITSQKEGFSESDVEKKGFNDLVSYVDKHAEKMLTESLNTLNTGAGFILEENTSVTDSDSELTWIIDPLDGTTNFVHGVPCYCISVALAEGSVPVAGWIFEISRGEMFTGWNGGGAYLNGRRINVSDAAYMSDSLIATGFPYHDFSFMEEYMRIFDHCMKNTRGLRRLGSAAADLAYLACGRFDAFYEIGLNAWDVAAGVIIVQEAGGSVTDLRGAGDHVFGREILASNGRIHGEFLKVTKSAMDQS